MRAFAWIPACGGGRIAKYEVRSTKVGGFEYEHEQEQEHGEDRGSSQLLVARC